MAIQKKSLISNRTATKKALVAKPEVSVKTGQTRMVSLHSPKVASLHNPKVASLHNPKVASFAAPRVRIH